MTQVVWKRDEPGIEIGRANSAGDFIDALRRSNSHWWEGGQMPWVFRGHAYDSWSLLPSAWRKDNATISECRLEATRRFDAKAPAQRLIWSWPPTNFHSGPATFADNDDALKRALAIEATAELLPIWDFALACNELGLSMPLVGLPPDPAAQPDWLWFPEIPLMADEFSTFADLLPMVGLAQHHGVPTRLLDWTLNPIAAAFFAIENFTEPVPDSDIVVWALHRRRATSVSTTGIEFPKAPTWPAPGLDDT